jgi:hypothetical protein
MCTGFQASRGWINKTFPLRIKSEIQSITRQAVERQRTDKTIKTSLLDSCAERNLRDSQLAL